MHASAGGSTKAVVEFVAAYLHVREVVADVRAVEHFVRPNSAALRVNRPVVAWARQAYPA